MAPPVPYDVEIEAALLGSALVDNFNLTKVIGLIEPAAFYDPLHQRMWAAMMRKHERGEVVSALTLQSALGDDPGLKEVGGRDYLVSLARSASVMPNVIDYAHILQELASRRELILAGEDLAQACFAGGDDVTVQMILTEHAARLQDVEAGRRDEGFVALPAAFDSVMTKAQKAVDGERPARVSTGIRELDDRIGGLQGGDLVIVAGRPGMGKTVMLTTICRAVVHGGAPALLFELEMSRDAILQRMICDEDFDHRRPGEPPLYYTNFRTGKIDEDDLLRTYHAQRRLRLLPLYIFDTASETMASIGAKAERIVAKSKTMGVIGVDYLQIVEPDARYQGNKVAEVTGISNAARRLSKRIGWPVVLGCQLSRETEKRQDKRPTLADLRETGAIEQDADIVIGCYREEYYLKHTEPAKSSKEHGDWLEKMGRAENVFEAIVLKNKHGPTPTVKCHCVIGSSAIRGENYERERMVDPAQGLLPEIRG